MINGFQYFSVEEHPLKERIWNASRWLRTENQCDVEPHTPWIALTWLGYRTLDGKFPFDEFVELEKRCNLPQMEPHEKARWECSRNTVLEYLRVLRGFNHDPSIEQERWIRMWPNTIINVLRIKALRACERYRKAEIQESDLTNATKLWNEACSRMIPNGDEWPHNLMESHKPVESLQIITQACWKAGVVKMPTHDALYRRWSHIWSQQEWHQKAWRKALEGSDWKP